MPITETIPTQTNKEINDFSTNGLPANGISILPFEEFQKLSLEDKEKYLFETRPEGPDLTMEEIVQIIKEGRNEK
jgi:hypothetical protein